MATLWTPDGEHPVANDDPLSQATTAAAYEDSFSGDGPTAAEAEAMAAELAELERDLLAAPVETIIANHCYGLFQIAALHLGQRPPHLDDARLAIDALAAVVDTLQGRLGAVTETLDDALAQIRLAYVQISAAQPTGNGTDHLADEGSTTP